MSEQNMVFNSTACAASGMGLASMPKLVSRVLAHSKVAAAPSLTLVDESRLPISSTLHSSNDWIACLRTLVHRLVRFQVRSRTSSFKPAGMFLMKGLICPRMFTTPVLSNCMNPT